MNPEHQQIEPPIVELVICAQFAHLPRLTTGHYGLFWKELGEEWVDSLDGSLIEDRFEVFGKGSLPFQMDEAIRITPMNMPGRIMFVHKNRDMLLQIQGTRFLLNWRKSDKEYPSYDRLKADFQRLYGLFEGFCKNHKVGELLINQWELTYVDSFPKNQLWKSPNQWGQILPGIFAKLLPTDDLSLRLDQRAAQWSFEITPERGRLHLNAHSAMIAGSLQETLLLTMTARGPVSKKDKSSHQQGLDLGHETILKAFKRLVDPDLIQAWGLDS